MTSRPRCCSQGFAERNLAAIWSNYRQLGYRRLIYTNTVSVLEIEGLSAAMGDDPHATGVLLTADDASTAQRLARREFGAELDAHLRRSRERATELAARAPASVHRVSTDGRSIDEVATAVLTIVGWGA